MKSYSGMTQQAKQAMRASFTKQQAKSSTGKHDRRNFDVENSQHIDLDRLENDVFYTWLDTEEYTCDDFDEAMLRFYEATYGDTLKRINDNYVKDRHPEKQKTMQDYLTQHMPEAFILQIGNVLDNVDADTLAECVDDYMEWEQQWNEEHGYPFEVLTMALHDDEATPHIHGTRAWRGIDKHGNVVPNREKALEQAGIELPQPNKKVSRYNNRNVTFTAMCRDKWLDICEEHGLNIIREPIKDVKSQNKGNFIREREKDYQERLNALETAQKALFEVEIQQHTEQYAIDSISLIQADKEKELAELENRLDDKEFELAETVAAVRSTEDFAIATCKEAKKYANMGDNSRASLMAEFMQGCKMGNMTAYDVFCQREPQLSRARTHRDYEIQRKVDNIMNKINSRNRDNDYDFMR